MICKRCDVEILSRHNACPLCHDELAKGSSNDYYPQYSRPKLRIVGLIKRIMAVASLSAVMVCIVIDLLVAPFGWSMIATAGIFAAWMVVDIDAIKKSWLLATIRGGLAGIMVVFIIDMLDGGATWSLAWVLPWTLVALTALLTVFIIINPTRLHGLYDSVVYILFMTAVSIALMICGLFGLFEPVWSAYICAAYHVITLVWLAVFGKRSVGREIAKRLHF